MSYPPGILRSCYEADGRSDRSGGSGDTGSSSSCGKFYRSHLGTLSDYNWHQQTQNHYRSHRTQQTQSLLSQTQSSWQKWAASFDALLSDGEGVALFKSFLESENCGNLLDFWFAVQGFRSKVDPTDRKKILQLIKVIYQTYIRGSTSVSTNGAPLSSASRNRRSHTPVRLRPETRRLIADRLAHKSSLDQTVFDDGQNEVGQVLRTTAYQAFLKSDIFIAHIQQGGSGSKPLSGPSDDEFALQKAYLPTVEEDRELGQPPLFLKDGVTPATYHYFCGPPMQHQQCTCQSVNPWSGACCSPAPLTQENIQMTRFQRAELPVPQHLSSCPHCQTPIQHQQQQQPQQQQVLGPSTPLSPPHCKSTGRISGAGQRKWMDAVCPKYEYYPSPLLTQSGFARAPPNAYHISFAPVSMQDSEHHSLSSGTHTEENLSHTDGICNEVRSRLHLSSLHYKSPRMPPNCPVFESPAVTSPNFAISTSGCNGVVGISRKHKRGVSASRRAPMTSTAVAAATTTAAPSKAVAGKDANLAEADPSAFARLLNERLQRVVEDRASTERLERLMAEVGNEEVVEESTEILGAEIEADLETTSTSNVQQSQQSIEEGVCKAMSRLSVASTSSTSTTKGTTNTTTTKSCVLRLPWADRLLAAAARVQRMQQEENAQAILEDHCSRIWDTSADRTPTSGDGSRGDAINTALLSRLPTFGKPSTQVSETLNKTATVEVEEEEEEDDCIHPPLLQESSSPLNATTTTTLTHFDFHQQVNESQLADIGSVGHKARFTSSPSASVTTDRGSTQSRSSSSSSGLVVGYYLCDDPVPYRSQWPSNVITLGQFKHLVPKKGTFRFFFKTTSDEFDSGVVHQEISDDNTVLPLWEGKVIAKVERVDVLQAEQ